MKEHEKTLNMLTYMEQRIDDLDFAGDLNLNWDGDIRSFELEIVMVGQTNDLEIENQEGGTADQEVSYDDAVLIYDQQRVDGTEYAENYLHIVPFAGRQGIEQATLIGLFDYLAVLLDNSMNNFLDFLDPEMSLATFQIEWSQSDFEQAVATAKEAGATGYFAYPKY